MPDLISRSAVLDALTRYRDMGDLSFINTVNNITFGYKKDMQKSFSTERNDLETTDPQ